MLGPLMGRLDNKTTGHILIFMKTTKEDKRATILDAGAELMLRQGYHGTGIQEIVDAAGVPKGSFYNYFKSKEDFALAAMEFTSRDHIAGFEAALTTDSPSPRQRMMDSYAAMAAIYEESRSYTTGCFVGNLCQELADTNAAVAEKAEYLFRIYTTALARCIRSAQNAGEVGRDADPDRLAEAIFNSWEGAILRMKSSRNILPLNAFLDMLAMLLQ
jgi:TetR/AcrR family transcriptional repressor of nem operon